MEANSKAMMESFSEEKLLWLSVVLKERFGHSFILATNSQGYLTLSLSNSERSLTFATDQATFTRADSNLPCTHWDATVEGWTSILSSPLPAPGASNLPRPLITSTNNGMHVAYDILGLTYWMLSRQEEVGRCDLDEHDRFPATSSHAYKYGYLERPVVDEWLHILRQVIQCIWPAILLKKNSFSINLTHDVDQPSLYAFKAWPTIARMMASHLIKTQDVKSFITAPFVKLTSKNDLVDADAYNTFNWLMDISEKNNLQSAFYFICGCSNYLHDADYKLDHPIVRKLLRRIHSRGHEIGLHPSYEAYKNQKILKTEFDHLKRVCATEGIKQTQWGGRMHYLRWAHPTTLRLWDDVGLTYDSTLGFADRAGFRCGTCFEYPAFDPVKNVQLTTRIRPLIVMECTVFDSAYMGLGISDNALNKILEIKNVCRRVEGQFVLLWHNSYLRSDKLKEMYTSIVSQ